MVAGEVIDMPVTLADNETIIERGMASFVEVGEALGRIKKGRLWADEFDSFEDYCKQRWGFSYSTAQRYIGAGEVSQICETHQLPSPTTVEAAKPLIRLMNEAGGGLDKKTDQLRNPKAAEKAVVQAMTKIAEAKADDDSPITGRDVSRIVSARASRGRPGWFELLGAVGDDLVSAGKHLAKAEAAIDREPNDDLKAKAIDYAGRADDLAARLRAIGQ